MTKEEFIKKVNYLKEHGYRLVCHSNANLEEPSTFRDDGSDYLYKVIERGYDKDGDSNAWNQLIFKIWHLENYRDRIPESVDLYSLAPEVSISRNFSENISLHLDWPEFTVEECEEYAVKFGNWVKENIPE